MPAEHRLTWRRVGTPNLPQDFIGSDGVQDVARIYQESHGKGEWFWTVFIVPGAAHGWELEPKEARRKAESAWERAKAEPGTACPLTPAKP